MIRFLLLTIIFVICAIGAAIAFTPLGFVLSQSGVANYGAGWAQAEGSLLNGRISGLHVRGQMVGDVKLKLRPMSLFTLSPTYDLQWSGAGGRGIGTLQLKNKQLIATDVTLQQSISSIQDLAPAIRALGGDVRLDNAAMTLDVSGCKSASGTVSSDVLEKAAPQYQRQFGRISGPLSCSNGNILLALNGASDAGDTLDIDASASLLGRADIEARLVTTDPEVSYLLQQIGFQDRNGTLMYTYAQPGNAIP